MDATLQALLTLFDYSNFSGVLPSFLRGIKVTDAKDLVLDALKTKDTLVALSSVFHDYPHCWRCKEDLVYRATHQWFCSLHSPLTDGHDGDLISSAFSLAKNSVEFFPPKTKSKFVSTLLDPHDWCLSRQRHWGVPLVALHCQECSQAYVTRELVDHVASKMETEGLEWWWKTNVSELGQLLVLCPNCGNNDFTKFKKEEDVLDVWFDSGSSNFAVLQSPNYRPTKFPCDVYFEGKDQHRGWFQSSLFCSMLARRDSSCGGDTADTLEYLPPCKNLLTHGFLVDEKGRKFSKSLGNGLGLDQVLELCSGNVDVIRLWACSCDWSKDVKVCFLV